MTTRVDQLLSNASSSPCSGLTRLGGALERLAGKQATHLQALLERRNGFYAFESALHVRGTCSVSGELGLDEWNSLGGWRSGYGELADECLFFGADLFGQQFCIHQEAVYRFDAETGGKEYFGASIEDWAGAILDDFEAQTGWPLAHEWQRQHGKLPQGTRLVPVTPFVLGGEFAVGNLRPVPSQEAMRFYADLAIQLRNVPDGAQVRLRVME